MWRFFVPNYYEASSTRNSQKDEEKGDVLGTKNLDFLLLLKKSIAIKICTLREDGVYSVKASFEEKL